MIGKLTNNIEDIVLIGFLLGALIFFTILLFYVRNRVPRKLKKSYFRHRCKHLQKLYLNKSNWVEAIIMADELLDEALKKRSYKGKNMGERLVSAQREFSDNDAVWFAHKLRNKLEQNPGSKLNKETVKDALLSICQGLKDLGAI